MSRSTHPRHRLDETIHAPIRFSIVATLAAATKAEFRFVRDTVEITDSALSKQIATLEAAGYVEVIKGFVGKRPRTWLRLTRAGRRAYVRHLAALRAIADRAAGADAGAGAGAEAEGRPATDAARVTRASR